jgi:hypothetical protein
MEENMMLKTACCLTLVLVLPLRVLAQSPVETDGDKYKVVMENAQVRVLEYKDLPGEKTHEHRHPAFVLYAVSAFKRKIHLPDGKVLMREFKAGDVMYSPEQVHIGENVGTTPTHVIMVELKTPLRP